MKKSTVTFVKKCKTCGYWSCNAYTEKEWIKGHCNKGHGAPYYYDMCDDWIPNTSGVMV